MAVSHLRGPCEEPSLDLASSLAEASALRAAALRTPSPSRCPEEILGVLMAPRGTGASPGPSRSATNLCKKRWPKPVRASNYYSLSFDEPILGPHGGCRQSIIHSCTLEQDGKLRNSAASQKPGPILLKFVKVQASRG